MSEQNPRPQGAPGGAPKKRRNRRRRPQGNQNSSAPTQATPAPTNVQASAPRKNKRRRRSGNKSPHSQQAAGGSAAQGARTSQLERLINKYENLRIQHLEARRKYFDLFERADPQQKDKLERVFTNTALKMKEFEDSLRDEDKLLFDQHYNGLKEDRIYSENHQLDPVGAPLVDASQSNEDPHFLISQKNANYSSDTEESVGTYEDYMSYKGLSSN